MERKAGRWLAILLLVPVLTLAGAVHQADSFSGSAQACAAIEGETTAAPSCCKVCKQGKACGNSCIAKNKKCHQPKGCACNG